MKLVDISNKFSSDTNKNLISNKKIDSSPTTTQRIVITNTIGELKTLNANLQTVPNETQKENIAPEIQTTLEIYNNETNVEQSFSSQNSGHSNTLSSIAEDQSEGDHQQQQPPPLLQLTTNDNDEQQADSIIEQSNDSIGDDNENDIQTTTSTNEFEALPPEMKELFYEILNDIFT